ncbi:MAG: tetratricopeptide repeat protein, partial [Tannerella sp.]|nr:tetratricopeptide repeat protein [Tannerella sp.]
MDKIICLFFIINLSCFFGILPVGAYDQKCDSILALPANQQHIDLLLEETIYKKELKPYTLKGLELSEQLNYPEGIMHALDQLGVMERNDSRYAEALDYHSRCLELAESHRATYWLMRSYINLSVVYRRINEYEKALQFCLKSFPLAEELKNEKEIASCLGNIGSIYFSLNKLDEAMVYFRKSLEKAIEQNNYQGLAISYGSIGRVYEFRNMLDSAQYCYERNLFYSMQWNDDNGIAISINSMGNVAKKKGDWKTALDYYRKALEMCIKIGDRNYIALNYGNLGEVYLLLDDTENAEKNYLLSLQTAQDAGIKKTRAISFGGLSKIYERQNRHAEALFAARQQIVLEDSVLNEENIRRIESLKISFEVEQKEQTIATLQAMNQVEHLKNRQKLIALLVCAVLLIGLSLFITMFARNSKQKRMITEQRVRQLEQEKILVATQAVLDGETRERTRLARDLHDGLGSILTGAKMSLLEMKEGTKLNYSEVESLEKTLSLLDRSVQEMRRVAHHLMPDSLARFGLKQAVNDFCNHNSIVSFAWYGEESRLDPKLEMMIYCCIHELVNNALKHARANQILVQIFREPDRIAFTVQDDGCGFDISTATTGMGLQNIYARVASFNGIL